MMNFSFDDFKAMRDFLTDVCDVNDEVIDCMCSTHGYTLETLDDVCYWKFDMTCEQKKKELEEEF